MGTTCTCGDVLDEHGGDPDYPGSTSCNVEGCECLAFESDGSDDADEDDTSTDDEVLAALKASLERTLANGRESSDAFYSRVDDLMKEYVGVCGHFGHHSGCQCENDD